MVQSFAGKYAEVTGNSVPFLTGYRQNRDLHLTNAAGQNHGRYVALGQLQARTVDRCADAEQRCPGIRTRRCNDGGRRMMVFKIPVFRRLLLLLTTLLFAQASVALGPIPAWAQIHIYKAGAKPLSDTSAYTKTRTDAQVALAAGTLNKPSDAVEGRLKTSVAPNPSTNPVAVEIHHPVVSPQSSGRVIYAAQHPDFATALAAAANSTLVVTTTMAISSSVTIPATTILKRESAGKLTKSGSGTIAFQGFGLADPKSQSPLFSGFAAGDITWTGADYPKEISTELWDTGNVSLSDRLARADLAFPSKSVKIIAYPRTVTTTVTFSANRHLHFTAGDYPNTISAAIFSYRFQSNFTATADSGATLRLAAVGGAGFSPVSLEVALENIFFDGLYFVGDPATTGHGAFSAIITGNAHKGAVRNCVFKDVQTYVAVGGYGTSGNFAENFDVHHNQWINTPTQALALINGKNINFFDNRFDIRGLTGTYNFTLIDVEPNNPEDRVENVAIRNNYFDMRSAGALSYGNAIWVQAANVPSAKNVVVEGNTAIGGPTNTFLSGLVAYGVDGLRVSGNNFQRAVQLPMRIQNCVNVLVDRNNLYDSGDATGLSSALHIQGVRNGQVVSNVLNRGNLVSRATSLVEYEIERTVTSTGSTVTQSGDIQPRFYDFWAGLTFTLNNRDYVVSNVSAYNTLTTTVAPGTLTAKSFAPPDVTVGTDKIRVPGHGFASGARVRLTSTGVLPAHTVPPIALGTATVSYYIIRVDADNLKLSASLANALKGTAIDLTEGGAGTHTITPLLVTKFSNNTYRGNAADAVTLEPTGTSRVL